MLNITVFGPGCAKCKQAEKLVRLVVEQMGVEADVEKVTALQISSSQLDAGTRK